MRETPFGVSCLFLCARSGHADTPAHRVPRTRPSRSIRSTLGNRGFVYESRTEHCERSGSLLPQGGQAGAWLILPLVFVIMFDVVTRKVDFIRLNFSEFSVDYGYSVPTILQDFEWHLHGIILLTTFGFGYLANAHVRVDVFREHIHPRKQAWLEFIGLFVMAVSYHQGEGSESLTGIPRRYVIKSFMIIGVVVLSMAPAFAPHLGLEVPANNAQLEFVQQQVIGLAIVVIWPAITLWLPSVLLV